MRREQRRSAVGLVAFLFPLAAASGAMAQNAEGAQSPEHYTVDQNNVDVIRGTFNHSATDVVIGSENGALAYTRTIAGEVQRGSFDGLIEATVVGEVSPGVYIWQYTVSLGGMSEFYRSYGATSMQSEGADGSTLEFDGISTYTHTDAAGTVRLFDASLANPIPPDPEPPYVGPPPAGPGGRITRLTKPNGERWDWYYRTATYGTALPVRRVQSVTSTLGYQVKFEYAFNGTPSSQAQLTSFGTLSRVVGLNNTIDWCDPNGDICSSLTRPWPQAQYQTTALTGGFRLDVTNALSQTTGYVFETDLSGSSYLAEIDWPEPGRASTTIDYTALKVSSYSDGRGTWTYEYIPDGISFQNTIATDPNGQETFYRARLLFGPPPGPTGDYREMQRLNWFEDPTGARTTIQYDEQARLVGLTYPEGNRLEYTRDTRGNITEVRAIAKPTAPAPDIVTSWVYSSTCTNRVTCNRPISGTDARGNTTDYTYSSTHGGLLTETQPAAGPGQDRPQTRYTYQALPAWYRTSASTTQVQGPPVTRSIQASSCTSGTAPSCLGTTQEVRTTTTYQAGNALVGSNLLPVTVTLGAGDSSLLATTTTAWDANGDTLTVDGPLPGTADTSWYAYDLMRRSVGSIAPDPDGGGPLPYPATRTVYNANGQPTEVEQGAATAQTQAALNAMTVLSEVVTTYDAQSRKAKEEQRLGTGTLGVTQFTYDDEGRQTCSAVRMNPAAYTSLPGSACDLGTEGIFGPDRITRNTYDLADRLAVIETGVGTSVAQTSRTQPWTPNGQVDWLEDANGNRSDYAYDGFDRLYRLYFPVTADGAHTASTTNYEEYAYDAGKNLISRRLRDGQTITFTYDNLDRETVKTVPGSGAANDVFTKWDLVGQRLSARYDNETSGDGVVWTWDALGRPTTETSFGRALVSHYDLAGRRTALIWPGMSPTQIDFDWDLADRMVSASEGAPPLGPWANYTYDALGRRTQLMRVGAATTTWTYVANSRDYSFTHDLSGSSNDVTFGLNFNPAGQPISRSTSNGTYQYPMATLPTVGYVPDGLNQYDSVAGTTFLHDDRGNLTSDGVRAYSYDVENRLVGVTGGGASVSLQYDPLGRLRRITSGGIYTDWLWDGDKLVAEYNSSGSITARYIHGPDADEALADIGGSARRWYLVDHQRSVVAETDGAGALTGTPYTYSPYGEPDGAHGYGGARFRYTGQTSLAPTVPLWHYKSRVYGPTLGRYLQTDPIGYGDGLNLYQYVRNSPFSLTDSTGMFFDEFDMWNEIGSGFPGEQDPNNTNYYELGVEWLFGTDDTLQIFTQDDPATETLRQHDHFDATREKIASGDFVIDQVVDDPFSLSGLGGVGEYLVQYAGIPTNGQFGNLAVGYTGSYGAQYKVSGVENGYAVVDWYVWNRSSLTSALRPPVVGYTDWWARNVQPRLESIERNGIGPNQALRTTEQRYYWTERVRIR